MVRLTSIFCRVLFLVAFFLAAAAVGEKIANGMGYTIMKNYSPWRLLEFAVVVLLFIIPLQLREIKHLLQEKETGL